MQMLSFGWSQTQSIVLVANTLSTIIGLQIIF